MLTPSSFGFTNLLQRCPTIRTAAVLKTAFETVGGSAPGSAKVSPFQNPCFQVEMICSTARSQFSPDEKI